MVAHQFKSKLAMIARYRTKHQRNTSPPVVVIGSFPGCRATDCLVGRRLLLAGCGASDVATSKLALRLPLAPM